MVRYFEAGQCEIEVVVNDDGVKLTPEQSVQKDNLWNEIVKNNPTAFNGEVWTCIGVEEKGNRVKIVGAIADYATTTWGRRNNRDIRSMGTAMLIFEKGSGDLVLARRTHQVVSDPGKISVIGGVLDTNTSIIDNDFIQMIVNQTVKELDEELSVIKTSKPIFLGVAVGPGNKIEWCCSIEVERVEIKDKTEATELIRIPRDNLVDFVKDNCENLELSTGWHLEHWMERIRLCTFPAWRF